MTAIGHKSGYAFSDRSVRISKMHVPRTRGALSGLLLLILGAWAAIVPFVGPYMNFAFTPAASTAWHWTAARGWFEVAPGAAAFLGGLLLLGSSNRAVAIFGSWLGIAGGAWLLVGPSLAAFLNQDLGHPDPASTTGVHALEELFFFYAVGAAIVFLASAALGRLSVQSVRDVAAAERVAQAEAAAAPATAERTTMAPGTTTQGTTTEGTTAEGTTTEGATGPGTTQSTAGGAPTTGEQTTGGQTAAPWTGGASEVRREGNEPPPERTQ